MVSNNNSQGLVDVTNTTKVVKKQEDASTNTIVSISAQESKVLQDGTGAGQPVAGSPKDPSVDRRVKSDEWDAAKTPPSRFQQPKGSIYATPNSRDAHIDKHIDRDAAFHAKLAEKGWSDKSDRRGSKGSKGK
ncbi:hypothetical protein EG329_005558 [Mollisiaceae sp. DMI_Dod_QoI]|nr:hypothetical protein EG329_005558 [Helotiales sp. DMI_Dod_QoI]